MNSDGMRWRRCRSVEGREGKGEWLDNNDGQRRRADYVFARVILSFSAIRRSFP